EEYGVKRWRDAPEVMRAAQEERERLLVEMQILDEKGQRWEDEKSDLIEEMKARVNESAMMAEKYEKLKNEHAVLTEKYNASEERVKKMETNRRVSERGGYCARPMSWKDDSRRGAEEKEDMRDEKVMDWKRE